MPLFAYQRRATLSAFQIISLIINRRRIDINGKLSHVEAAKKLAESVSTRDFSGAMLRLHYRISKLLEWDGLLHELDQQIGREDDDEFQEFVKTVIPDYLNFFGIDKISDKTSRPNGKESDNPPVSDKTPTGGTTSAGVKAMTDDDFWFGDRKSSPEQSSEPL